MKYTFASVHRDHPEMKTIVLEVDKQGQPKRVVHLGESGDFTQEQVDAFSNVANLVKGEDKSDDKTAPKA